MRYITEGVSREGSARQKMTDNLFMPMTACEFILYDKISITKKRFVSLGLRCESDAEEMENIMEMTLRRYGSEFGTVALKQIRRKKTQL